MPGPKKGVPLGPRVERAIEFADGRIVARGSRGQIVFAHNVTLDQAMQLYDGLKSWLNEVTHKLVHQGIIDVLAKKTEQ